MLGEGSDNVLSVEEMVLEENKMLRDEGRRIGISEGKKIGKRIMCINMLKMGYSIETISKISGISVKKLENLKKSIK